MPMNQIQFQRGLPLPEFLAQYGTETQCETAVEQARWPTGFCCPRCGHSEYTLVHQGNQRLRQCRACAHQASLRVGTVFESSKLPLTLWFLAIYLMTQSKNSISALELKRTLGVSYKTAWVIKHKLMRVMVEREEDRVLSGRVEADDAYLGGVRKGQRGRGAAGKTPMIIAVQTKVDERTGEAHPWFVRLDVLPNFRHDVLVAWAEQALDPETLMVSDGLSCFVAAGAQVNLHQRVVVGVRKSSELDCFHWVNTLLGNIKSSIQGTYHGFSVRKYAARYLGEIQYRFNRRFDLSAMIPRLLKSCVLTPPCIEKHLRFTELCN
jgi:hypothetical protein